MASIPARPSSSRRWRRIEIDAPRGPVRLDLATKSPIQNIYIKKVEKKKMFGYDKDELWNTVIKTYTERQDSTGNTTRRSSWRSRSIRAISRPANSANKFGLLSDRRPFSGFGNWHGSPYRLS